jgi:hypothetical protein
VNHKKIFSGSAIGFNQRNEICNTYGIFGAYSEAEAIGLLTLQYRKEWGAEPATVALTEQSMLNLRQMAYSSGAVGEAIGIAVRYGGTTEAHHLAWVVDQMVRSLAGDDYDRLVAEACDGEDGANTCDWDCGIAP